jgi:hypothetical protein
VGSVVGRAVGPMELPSTGPPRYEAGVLARSQGAVASFVGREREAQHLRELLTDHRAVLVCGDAGVGKTALVEHALANSELPEALFVSVRGAVGLRDVLERLAFAVGSARPYSRGEAVDGALLQLVDGRPRTFVLDDADDADVREAGPTLRAFIESAGRARVVIVCRVPLSAEEAGVRIPAMRVGPLDDASARTLVEELERVHGDLVGKLVRACAGNPGLLELALRAEALALPAAGAAVEVATREATTAGHAPVLGLLAAAEVALDEAALVAELGRDARRSLSELSLRGLVRRHHGRVELVPLAGRAMARTLDPALIESPEVALRVLAVARAWLDASGSADALAVAVLAATRGGKPDVALSLLREHGRAAARLPQTRLAQLAMDALGVDEAVGHALLALLAREQLRSGNYEELDATLERFANDRSVAMRLVRADAYLRRGRPSEAERELDGLEHTREVRPAMAIILAMKGETERARALLAQDVERRDQEPKKRAKEASVPRGARRLAVAIASTYLFDDLPEEVLVALEPVLGDSSHAIVTLARMVALMDLDRIADAEAALARVGSFMGLSDALSVALGSRSGKARDVLPRAAAVLAAFEPESNVVYRIFFLRCVHEAALAAGDFVAAEGLVSQMEALTARPGLERLADIARVERARQDVALGDVERGRAALRELAARMPSPRVAIESRAGAPSAAPRSKVRGASASLEALTDARRWLDVGEPKHARVAANAARDAYTKSGVQHLRAEACLLASEACVALGRADEALERLGEAEALCREHGYAAMAVSVLLLRARAARDAGDLAFIGLVAQAAREAARVVDDASVDGAARELGLRVGRREGEGALRSSPTGAPFAGLVRRLGLDQAITQVFRAGEKTWLLPEGAPPPMPKAMIVDVRAGHVRLGRRTVTMPAQRLTIVEALADAGAAGLDLESLHACLHEGASYHPLRHRNALYVALNRARDALRGEEMGELKRTRTERYVLGGDWLTHRNVSLGEIALLAARPVETAAQLAAQSGCGAACAAWAFELRSLEGR